MISETTGTRRRADLESSDLECCWIELLHGTSDSVLCASVFIPTYTKTEIESRLRSLTNIVMRASVEKIQILLVGDGEHGQRHQTVKGIG